MQTVKKTTLTCSTRPGNILDDEDDASNLTLQNPLQLHKIYHNHGSRIIGGIVHYLKERQENFDRWSRTLFGFKKAPMTLSWGVQDPVAVVAMADRIKRERPVT